MAQYGVPPRARGRAARSSVTAGPSGHSSNSIDLQNTRRESIPAATDQALDVLGDNF